MLDIQHLTKTYRGGKRAVDDLTLRVPPGQIVGFIGHNGAGKTTTLKGCAGILPFDAGEIRVCGHSIVEEPVLCKREMAFIPDNPELYNYLTGVQFIAFILDVYGVPKEGRVDTIDRLAGELELLPSLGELVASYSHGMKQKLALVAAFAHKPRLLLLDEPFVGLDPRASFTLKAWMRALCNEGGAIFFSTHVLEVAEKLCDRIAILKEGRLVVEGPTDEVRGQEGLEAVFMGLTERSEP